MYDFDLNSEFRVKFGSRRKIEVVLVEIDGMTLHGLIWQRMIPDEMIPHRMIPPTRKAMVFC
jgi:hypothetical protein